MQQNADTFPKWYASTSLVTLYLSQIATPFPHERSTSTGTEELLSQPLMAVLSEFVRRTRMPLHEFVEPVRGQTAPDHRPKNTLVPEVIATLCAEYPRLAESLQIAKEGAHVRLSREPPDQPRPPPNHGSADERVNELRKNIRREQDAGRCLILDNGVLAIWPDVHFNPSGIVENAGGDPQTTGRVIYDLFFSEDASINDCTDPTSIPRLEYEHCDAIAIEISWLKREHLDTVLKIMAGDVAAAFRNVSIHSCYVHNFAGRNEADDVIVIELSAPFGWIGLPGVYEVIGGAINFVHGSHYNSTNPQGFSTYHWVDDHINVAADSASTCTEMDQSLRFVMTAILGCHGVNKDKLTLWSTARTVLGLRFDSITGTVSMSDDKTMKARTLISYAFHATELSRRQYR